MKNPMVSGSPKLEMAREIWSTVLEEEFKTASESNLLLMVVFSPVAPKLEVIAADEEAKRRIIEGMQKFNWDMDVAFLLKNYVLYAEGTHYNGDDSSDLWWNVTERVSIISKPAGK